MVVTRTLRMALALLALVAVGCTSGGGTVLPTNWWLSGAPNGRSLEVTVLAGPRSCDVIDDVRIHEHDDRVRIEATVRREFEGPGSCSTDPTYLRVPIRLNAPLGSRVLTGCAPLDDRLHPSPNTCDTVATPPDDQPFPATTRRGTIGASS